MKINNTYVNPSQERERERERERVRERGGEGGRESGRGSVKIKGKVSGMGTKLKFTKHIRSTRLLHNP